MCFSCHPEVKGSQMRSSKPWLAAFLVWGQGGGGNPEAIEEGSSGFVTESEDADTAADRILRLLRDPNLASEMGSASKEIVEARFTAKRMIDQLVRHYDQLLIARQKKNVAGL